MYTLIEMTEQSFFLLVRHSYLTTRSDRVGHKIMHVSRQDETRHSISSCIYVYDDVDELSNARFFFLFKKPLQFMRVNGFKLLEKKKIHSIFIFLLRT